MDRWERVRLEMERGAIPIRPRRPPPPPTPIPAEQFQVRFRTGKRSEDNDDPGVTLRPSDTRKDTRSDGDDLAEGPSWHPSNTTTYGDSTTFETSGGYSNPSDYVNPTGYKDSLGYLDSGEAIASEQPTTTYEDFMGDTPAYGTADNYQLLDSRYRVEPSHYFIPGKVVEVLWSEPSSTGYNGISWIGDTHDNVGGKVYVAFRRFAVVSSDDDRCICVPIRTYKGKACTRIGVKPQQHGVVYQQGRKPRTLLNEPELGFKPLAVQIEAEGEKLTKQSRINYSKLVTVEHNAKVLFIGHVVDTDALLEAVNEMRETRIHQRRRVRFSSKADQMLMPKTDPTNPIPVLIEARGEQTYPLNGPQYFEDPISAPPPVPPVAESDILQYDSGYHSRSSNSMSMCSDTSDGTSLGLPKDTLQECISYVGNHVINAVGRTPWFQASLTYHKPEFIDTSLADALKDFSLKLTEKLTPGTQDPQSISSEAVRIIRRYRPRISRYIRVESRGAYLSADGLNQQRLTLAQRLSPLEVIALLDRRNTTASGGKVGPGTDTDYESDQYQDESEEEDELDENLDLSPVSAFLFGTNAFSDLCKAIHQALYNADPPAMSSIRTAVIDSLRSSQTESCPNCLPFVVGPAYLIDDQITRPPCVDHVFPHSFSVSTDWKPAEFLASQFGKRTPPVGTVITYTGLASYGLATTCSEYLRMTWPSSGDLFLDALDVLLRPRHRRSPDSKQAIVTSNSIHASLYLSQDGRLHIEGRGTQEGLIDLAQQVAWISTAMSLPPPEEERQDERFYCNASLSLSNNESETSASDTMCRMAMKCDFELISEEEQLQNCWLDLVNHAAVIAHHFPVPGRHDEKGLEIPISMLAHLAGVHHVVEFQGGVVMKGPTSMLLPVSRKNEIVQWHLVSSPDTSSNEGLTYQDGVQQCRQRALIDQVSIDSLHYTRAVVGWCGHATTRLGLDEMNYGNLEYSAAGYDKSSLNFSGVAIGVQHFGAGQANFKPGPKDYSRYHRERKGTYRNVLNSAAKTKVLLYDTTEQRAWLVRADEVILHMIQKQRFDEPFIANGRLVELKTGKSSADTLSLNKNLVVWDEDDDVDVAETFKDLVNKTWSLLEAHVAWEVEIGRSQERPVKLPLREELAGYEFMAITEERSPYARKRCKISSKTSGGWTSLVEDIRPLVLFASGFEDLIVPDDNTTRDQTLCHVWKTVPKQCDYLATSVEMIMDLYYTSGHRQNRECLTNSGLRWHQGGMLFGPCQKPGSYRCTCDRLQQILPELSAGRVVAPGPLVAHGAVIFGRSSFTSKLPASPAPTPPTREEKGKGKGKGVLYSQPNISGLGYGREDTVSDDGTSSDGAEMDDDDDIDDDETDLKACSSSGTSGASTVPTSIGEETSLDWTMGTEMDSKFHFHKAKHVYRQENAAAG